MFGRLGVDVAALAMSLVHFGLYLAPGIQQWGVAETLFPFWRIWVGPSSEHTHTQTHIHTYAHTHIHQEMKENCIILVFGQPLAKHVACNLPLMFATSTHIWHACPAA